MKFHQTVGKEILGHSPGSPHSVLLMDRIPCARIVKILVLLKLPAIGEPCRFSIFQAVLPTPSHTSLDLDSDSGIACGVVGLGHRQANLLAIALPYS